MKILNENITFIDTNIDNIIIKYLNDNYRFNSDSLKSFTILEVNTNKRISLPKLYKETSLIFDCDSFLFNTIWSNWIDYNKSLIQSFSN